MKELGTTIEKSVVTLETIDLEQISPLTKELRMSAKELNRPEARYLVDAYYQIQEYRIRAGNQLRREGMVNKILQWQFDEMKKLEDNIKKLLASYTSASPLGRWATSITGIGPVLAAGLMAHIDIEKAPSVGHIWRYAGLDPTVEWRKGQKRPWNAELKRLCWLIGESFVKQYRRESDIYGKLYIQRKEYETAKNERGEYAEEAKRTLETKSFGKDTEAYKWYAEGKLPPARIHERAKRYAVKIFLSHYHHVAYELRYGVAPPRPYAIQYLGHVDYIPVPNWPLEG